MSDPTPSVRPDAVVSLREITAETFDEIAALSVAPAQQRFVAPNAYSIAQASFYPQAWFRAVYADETPVGFVMLFDDPEKEEYFLWRFMIDARYQGMGLGRQALARLLEHVKTRPGARELGLSCVPGEDGPELFYRRLGFVPTGQMHGEEMEMKLVL